MQSDRDLFKQALEALEEPREHIFRHRRLESIAALRERLAQPEQDWDWRHPKAQALIGAKARLQIKLRLVEQLLEDPNLETTASDMEYWEPLHDKLQERLSQPVQEPVVEIVQAFADLTAVSIPVMPPVGTKLYTTPPRREWVGLTDEEYSQLHDGFHQQGKLLGWVVDQVEDKLREKNG